MNKYIKITLILILFYFCYSYFTRAVKFTNTANADVIFYYGEECPHCHVVLKYITDNKIDQKIKIQTKEVYHNDSNKADFVKLAKKCPEIKDSSGNMGVPVALFIKDDKCIAGDQPIIDQLQKLIN